MKKEIILTGLRANGTFHLGNYLGAILPMVELQTQYAGQYQINMFVPDLHSFTTPTTLEQHARLFRNTIQNLKMYMAAGLDIHDKDTFVYRQSYIPAHSELTWILDCFAYFGEMSRMTQFKEKSEGQANVSVGLFNYPVLMAADILLYGAKWVPVGEDQRQHLEIARDVGERVNNKFNNELFTLPEPWEKQLTFAKRDTSVRIRSLVNPEKKMSKSVSDPKGTINLTDTPDEAAKKIMSATTDSFGEIKFDFTNRPGISNLLQILALLQKRPQTDVNTEWEGKQNYGELKSVTAKEVQHFLSVFQEKLASVDEVGLMAKLEESEEYMREATGPTLYKVQQAVGLRPKE